MSNLLEILEDYQHINIVEKGISFTEEAFTQIYDEAIRFNVLRMDEKNIATGKGILIGAISVGLIGLGIKGYKKMRKRKFKESEDEENVWKNLDGVKMFKPEVMEIDNDGKVTVRVSKKDRDTLKAIIEEINENEKH